MKRRALATVGLALTLCAIAGCSGRDETKGQLDAASTQVATLQAQLGQALVPTPTPFGSGEYCRRVDEWQAATTAAEKVWDDSVARGTFRSQSAQAAISGAYQRAWVIIFPPAPGGNLNASRLSELIASSITYSQHLVTAAAAYIAISQDGSTASEREKIDAQAEQQALLIEIDNVSGTISKFLPGVCGTGATLRGRVP